MLYPHLSSNQSPRNKRLKILAYLVALVPVVAVGYSSLKTKSEEPHWLDSHQDPSLQDVKKIFEEKRAEASKSQE